MCPTLPGREKKPDFPRRALPSFWTFRCARCKIGCRAVECLAGRADLAHDCRKQPASLARSRVIFQAWPLPPILPLKPAAGYDACQEHFALVGDLLPRSFLHASPHLCADRFAPGPGAADV